MLLLTCSFSCHKRWNYFKDYSNQSDWTAAVLSLLFVIPLMLNVEGSLHWQAGALAILNCWIGFLLYLQRCSSPWLNHSISKSSGFMVWCRLTGVYMCVLQIWGCWHLCCDVLGDHEDTGPGCDALLLPDVRVQFGFLCSDAEPGRWEGPGIRISGIPLHDLKVCCHRMITKKVKVCFLCL